MARSFSAKEAKTLIEDHQLLLRQLKIAEQATETYRRNARKAAEAALTAEVMKVLEEIPVEEINREKRGFRIKALRASGYQTIADLACAPLYAIASVYGISEDAAFAIKRVVDDMTAKVRQGIKLRLSTDRKSQEATQLVAALHKYRKSREPVSDCMELVSQNEAMIEDSLEDIKPALNGFAWFFASKGKKQRATEAYQTLLSLRNGSYYVQAKQVIAKALAIEKLTADAAWDDFSKHSVRFFTDLEEIAPGILGNDDSKYGLPEDLAREIQDECFFPEGLLCQLRRYQEWGVKYILHQERVLLGDEMGLGKTVQAIAAMVSLRNTGATHFVVVCPASVITNWCREITKMSTLRVTKVHGSGRGSALQAWISDGGVAVTTYETTGHFNLEQSFRYAMLVVDEAHYLKNPDARRTIQVKALSAHTDRMLYMTGTALENRVDEMIALIKMLQPAIAMHVQGMEAISVAPQFREIIAPVYYRRKREDVLTELPELIESKEWCVLTRKEEERYEQAILEKNYADARRVSWNIDDLQESSKAGRLLELIEEAESEGRKIIVFSFFLETIRKISLLLGNRCTQPINGSVSPQRRQEIIDDFDKAPAGTVLLAQIQSGGTGLNIQSASVIIFCEPQFKPSIENQAISRAYRMGQTRNVLVYRLLCDDTVDEKITALLESKQAIFDAFADKSVAAIESRELDERTFGNIIQEEIDRIQAKQARSGTMHSRSAPSESP